MHSLFSQGKWAGWNAHKDRGADIFPFYKELFDLSYKEAEKFNNDSLFAEGFRQGFCDRQYGRKLSQIDHPAVPINQIIPIV